MISFANPQYLYLLLIIPVIVLLFLASRHARKKKLKKFGRIDVLQDQMPDVSKYKHWIRLAIELLLVAVVAVMLARPRAGAKQENVKLRGIEVMVALDVSNSMLASSTDDAHGVSRLQKSKLILEKLLSKLHNDKVGLVVFAGNAYMQLPITSDLSSAKMFLNSINTNMVPSQGTAIGAAIEMAMNSFTPNEKTGKAIILITDGENHEDDAIGMAQEAAKQNIQVNVIGMGTTNGAPIPMGNGAFLKDDEGAVVTTHLDEEMAMGIARAAKGIYVSGSRGDAVSEVGERLKDLATSEIDTKVFTKHDEQFPVFAWIALVLLVAGMVLRASKNSWLRKYNFFTKNENKQ